ncbi:sulfotransferase [Akkermansiaceae bacterium]|nr:sulfotransferase [Akkermansiaceae bacterium]
MKKLFAHYLDMNDKDFLDDLNESLGRLNNRLSLGGRDKYLNIFVLGLPRSGTTLLTQLLYSCMNVQCTNNLMAKFWNSPLVGAKLSSILLSKKESNYNSNLGSTELLSDPHEFSWFWQSRLNYNQSDKSLDFIKSSISQKNLDKLFKEINDMNCIVESSMIHKPLELLIPFLSVINSSMSNALFIYIFRPDLEVASSLLNARESRFGDTSKMWGSIPFGISPKEFDCYSVVDQVAIQIKQLKLQYEQEMDSLNDTNLIRVSYEELCLKPLEVIETIVRSPLSVRHGLKQTCSQIPIFSPRNSKVHPLSTKVLEQIELL